MSTKVALSGTAKKGMSGKGVCPGLELALESLGFEIVDFKNSEILINLNHNEASYKKFNQKSNRSNKCFLIALEPISVYPAQYREKIQRKYSFVFFPGNALRQSSLGQFLPWPYVFNENPSSPKHEEISVGAYLSQSRANNLYRLENWKRRKHVITAIAANKISPTSSNLYTLRQELFRNLPVSLFNLYGPLWNDDYFEIIKHRLSVAVYSLKSGFIPNPISILSGMASKYPSARGPVNNKHSILSDSKFSLVIENSNENVTEKLFDSLINGSIPIYIGPKLNSVGLPEHLAIEGLVTSTSIVDYIGQISDDEVSRHLKAITNFVHSKNFLEFWSANHVWESIALEIQTRERGFL